MLSRQTYAGDVFFDGFVSRARIKDTNNQAVDNNGGDKKDPNVNDKQEVKKVDDQEIENVKDEERKNVKDQQVSERTINETADTITSLQSEVASLDAKGSLDTNEEIKKDHTRVHELEKQVEKLPMELQLKNNFREALETTSEHLEKKMLDLNPTLHDPQKVVIDQKKKHYKTKYALKIDDEEFKKAKSEAITKIRKLAKNSYLFKEEYGIPESREFSRHHLEDKVVCKEWGNDTHPGLACKRFGGVGDEVLNWTSSGVIGERSMKDEEVPLVDGVFEGALGALGDES
ncbi:hypothetical protein Tco_0696785 [Tanacetum coccineum]